MRCLFIGGTNSRGEDCLIGTIASIWVSLYHSAFRSSASVENENAEIRMSLIQHDLSACSQRLGAREAELLCKIKNLTREALHRKSTGDTSGAKKRLLERKRVQGQLDKITNSMSIIDMHMNTIEGTELNRSILETLKASGDALRRMGVKGGLDEVERVVSEVEGQVEAAAEVNRIISSANVTGSINTMAIDGISEEDLEEEFAALMYDGGGDSDSEDKNLLATLPAVPSKVPSLTGSQSASSSTLRNPPQTSSGIYNRKHPPPQSNLLDEEEPLFKNLEKEAVDLQTAAAAAGDPQGDAPGSGSAVDTNGGSGGDRDRYAALA